LVRFAKLWTRFLRIAIKDIFLHYKKDDCLENEDFVSAMLLVFRDDYKINFGGDFCPSCVSEKDMDLSSYHTNLQCRICDGRGIIITEKTKEANLEDIIDITVEIYRIYEEVPDFPISIERIRSVVRTKINNDSLVDYFNPPKK
jgi:hypothetical protein